MKALWEWIKLVVGLPRVLVQAAADLAAIRQALAPRARPARPAGGVTCARCGKAAVAFARHADGSTVCLECHPTHRAHP